MKFVCLVYSDEEQLRVIADAECASYSDTIRESGHRLGGEALQPVETAATVRVRNGQMSITDGPFAETKEQLAGFYLIDAATMDEAIKIASRIPPARVGSIEVRPVRELDVPEREDAAATEMSSAAVGR